MKVTKKVNQTSNLLEENESSKPIIHRVTILLKSKAPNDVFPIQVKLDQISLLHTLHTYFCEQTCVLSSQPLPARPPHQCPHPSSANLQMYQRD